MGLREASGYCAHGLLALYWVWLLSCTAPQLRKSSRGRGLKVRVLLTKTAGIGLTALLVGVIHFWATDWWQVITAILVAAVLGVLLHRVYRRLVAAPKHRLTLGRRVQMRRHRRPGLLPAGPPVVAEPFGAVGAVVGVEPLDVVEVIPEQVATAPEAAIPLPRPPADLLPEPPAPPTPAGGPRSDLPPVPRRVRGALQPLRH